MVQLAKRFSPTGDLTPFSPEALEPLAEALSGFIGVDEANIVAAVEVMQQASPDGSVLGFMRSNLSLTEDMQDAMKEALLENATVAKSKM